MPLEEQLRAAPTLQAVLRILEVDEADWQYCLVSDGSGMTWKTPCGWGSTLIHLPTGNRFPPFFGSFSCGTNNVAELMGVIHPLLWLANTQSLGDVTSVVILTDSGYVAKAMRPGNREKNYELFDVFESLRRRGFQLIFRWIPRDTIDLNRLADALAGMSRTGLDVNLGRRAVIKTCHGPDTPSLYDLCPDEREVAAVAAVEERMHDN